MTIHVALTHETRYHYDHPVQLGPQTIRLRPAAHSRTSILSYSLAVEPRGHFLNWQQDPYGNFLARVVFPEPVESFEVKVDLVADMAVYNPFDFFLEPDAEKYPFEYEPSLRRELEPFLDAAPAEPALRAWLDAFPRPKAQPTADFLVELNQRLSREIEYVVRMEPGIQTPQETLTLKRRSCRDSSWLLVQILRHLGLAAKRHARASELSHGEQRYLEIGIALATEPDFLLLDEPTAGMSPDETRRTAAFVRRLAGHLTIVVVEHDMEVVMGISDRITVLNYGEILAEGTPAEIRESADVRRVYLRD